MGDYKPICGFDACETKQLSQRYHQYIKQDCTWQSREEFIAWCSEVDYISGARLRKYDETKPYGPDNAYFYVRTEPAPEPEPPLENCPCDGCENPVVCCESHGCGKWGNWFLRNWDENIHREIVRPAEKRGKFQYEHPDLVREGIVWNS